ncbi:mitogen-activated protein kinase kinase kinase 17-like [Oryza glaberrima]|uniref:mitogen-activated protein kinase kinase kinase 17-like n=1 Tax=Oryza glaberrima TaxID=4538 RepID=UPI00224C28EB|nr:mitogen-activated protein kinase kinase kinase 17-like [Oryza glaberrima]
MAIAVSGRWTRLRTLGRGASGAVVSLAEDGASGELFAVKTAAAAEAAMLRRERGMMSGLSSPHVVPCIGGGDGPDGSYNLFLEFAPGGSLANEVARDGGRLEERAIRVYAADVLRGLTYLHGMSLVHGDVKADNIVIGVDGLAKLADFGCAKTMDSERPVGGTPAFMAPEVARGEEQGPAADVWALGCTVIEMATGRAPWSDMDDVLAAVHRIGYTDAVPEVPVWLSAEAKDFLAMCFERNAGDRSTAAQLLEHPFVAFACHEVKAAQPKPRWVSPKSTLDAAFWESETDDEEEVDEITESLCDRIKSLACPVSALPDWDSDEGWIDLLGEQCEACDSEAARESIDVARSAPSKVSSAATVPAAEVVLVGGGCCPSNEADAFDQSIGGDIQAADRSIERRNKVCAGSDNDVLPFRLLCNGICAMEFFQFFTNLAVLLCLIPSVPTMFSSNCELRPCLEQKLSPYAPRNISIQLYYVSNHAIINN